MRQTRVRLIDIAKEAGVSPAGVSQVLNGSASKTIRVSKEKAELVRQIAHKLNYRPDMIARALVGRKSNLIGAFIDSQAPEPYFEILSSLFFELRTHGYHLLICEGHDCLQDITNAYYSFAQYGVGGMAVLSHNYDKEERLQLPDISRVVFLEKPAAAEACYLDIDYAEAIRTGVRHLLDLGRRRIGLILSNLKSYTLDMRLKGFKEETALRKDQLECALIHVSGGLSTSLDELDQQYREFIEANRLNGVLMLEDNRAAGMARICAEHGRRIPEDLALIGFGNTKFGELVAPSLTSFQIDTIRCGGALAEMLLQLVDGAKPTEVPPLIIPPTLIVRESTVGRFNTSPRVS